MTSKPFSCSACNKRFVSAPATRDHIRIRHARSGADIMHAVERVQGRDVEDDESFADRAVEAEIAIASGLHTDDAWLLGRSS